MTLLLSHHIHVPFNKVATYSRMRQPYIVMNDDVIEWMGKQDCWWDREWLINGSPEEQDTTWRVRFMFENRSDALLFKLTFGGA